ncbi:MAG: hypothetical protein SGBAC_000540 [Bacillariaceae sp.]
MFRARSALAFRAVPFLHHKYRCKPTNSALLRFLTTQTDDEIRIYEELKWLSSEIIRNDQLYYNEQPVLEDEEFDALVRRENEIKTQFPDLLKKLQKDSGLGTQATRDGRVGSGSNTERIKRNHLRPMLSLDNAHDEPQLLSWLNRVSKATVEVLSETNATVQILTEPKLDGISLSLRYELAETLGDGGSHTYELSWAATRGDGRVGQEVTEAVASIPDIPKSLNLRSDSAEKGDDDLVSTIEIRGEVVFPKTQFQSLSDNYTFSNTRNAAAGIMNRKPTEDPEEAKEAKNLQAQLQFYAYDVVGDKQGVFANGIDNRAMMQEWGLLVPEPAVVTELKYIQNTTQEQFSEQMKIEKMLAYYESLRRHRLDLGPESSDPEYNWRDFDMDGCVHKVVNPDIKQEMGRSMKSPNWAVAHKYPAVSAITELIDVIVQVGRTGVLTPVAVLKPVAVGGVTISRATLHNFDHAQALLGNITSIPVNTSVLVRRAGDVIPQVVSRVGDVLQKEGDANDGDWISLEIPKQCTACGSDATLEMDNGTATGPIVRCTGPPMLCRPQAITSLRHAYSRDALDVRGLSESRIQHLMDADLLNYPADIFNFTQEDWGKLEELPGWGAKSVQNLQSAARKVATQGVPLRRFLYSLGIRHMGKHSSELVASTFGTKKAFLKAMDAGMNWKKPSLDGLEEEKVGETVLEHPFSKLKSQLGIGESILSSLLSFANNQGLADAARDLASAIKILDEPQVQASAETANLKGTDDSKPWKGMRVVFTGAIPNFTRSSAHSAAKSLGAKATPGSVSKSTDLVVYGDKGGKKLKQAIQYGVDTLAAEEFIQLVKEFDLVD